MHQDLTNFEIAERQLLIQGLNVNAVDFHRIGKTLSAFFFVSTTELKSIQDFYKILESVFQTSQKSISIHIELSDFDKCECNPAT